MQILEKIKNLLDSANIDYTLAEHEPTITSADAARIRSVELKTGAKAMIARSKDTYLLFVLPADRRIDWKKVKNIVGVRDISLASEEEILKLTGLVRGSVPPLGNILGIRTYFDEKLLENEYVNFNAGSVSHSVNMRSEDLVRLVNPEVASFSVENDSVAGKNN